MSIFNNFLGIFKKKAEPKNTEQLGATSIGVYEGDFRKGFSSVENARPELNAVYCNCVDTLVRHVSMIQPKIMFHGDEYLGTEKNKLKEILSLRPNEFQTASEFYSTMCHDYFMYGCCFAYMIYDYKEKEPLRQILPIDPGTLNISVSHNKEIYVTFIGSDNKEQTASLSDCLFMIRKPSAKNPLYSTDNSLKQVLSTLQANTDGLEQAVLQSHLIRYIMTTPQVLSPDKIKALRKDFESQLSEDKSGLVILGQSQNLQAVSSQSTYAKQPEIDTLKEDVYSYFGLTKDATMSNMTDDQRNSMLQSAVNPFINNLEQELSYKIFSSRQRNMGFSIEIDTFPIYTASLSTRINIVQQLISSGMYQPNTIYRLLGLRPIENGDKTLQSLNFVDSNVANEYQTGNKDTQNSENNEENDTNTSNNDAKNENNINNNANQAQNK